jgi:hypothetical protein
MACWYINVILWRSRSRMEPPEPHQYYCRIKNMQLPQNWYLFKAILFIDMQVLIQGFRNWAIWKFLLNLRVLHLKKIALKKN